MTWLFPLALLAGASPQSGEVTPPRQIYMPPVEPFYPASAKARDEQGLTQLRCTLAVTGRLTDCVVHSSSGSLDLDQAAFRIAEEARYEPKRVDGRPVAIPAILPVRWVLAE